MIKNIFNIKNIYIILWSVLFWTFFFIALFLLFNFNVFNFNNWALIITSNFRGVMGSTFITLIFLSIPLYLAFTKTLINNKFFDKKKKPELKEESKKDSAETDELIKIREDIPEEIRQMYILAKKYNKVISFENFEIKNNKINEIIQTNNIKSDIPNPFQTDTDINF